MIFMSGNSGKSTTLVLILLGLGVLVLLLAAREGRDRPISTATMHAVRQNLISWITTNGKVEPVEPHIIQSPLTTFIESVAVKEGQRVDRGQLLMTLDAKDLKTELAHMREQLVAAENERKIAVTGGSPEEIAQLDSDLVKTNAEIDRLRSERDSLERLYAKQAATRQEIEQTKTALAKAEADKRLIEEKRRAILERSKPEAERATLRIEEARNSIQSLEDKLKSARVTAPAGGTAYSLPARAGTYAHTGDLLAELADLTRIRIRVFVDEPELGSLKQGQAVEITWEALSDRTWKGLVDQLPKTIVARGTRNVGEVLCSVDNKTGELLPNTNVNVRIRTAQRENTLTLSRAAVRGDGNARYVFVVEQDRLRKRDVKVGISNATDYEILSGITENDIVALPGASEFQEGMAVTVAQEK
jgi:HlyD family secretion protein